MSSICLTPVRSAPKMHGLISSSEEFRLSIGTIGRGSLLGFLIGSIPGSAHIVSSFVSYRIERRMSKHPERFGKGAIEDVAGPESANNAAATDAFVPMLALGIPTSPVTAVMIAAIMVHGISPGPMLIQEQSELFWGFVASMYVDNVVLLVLNLPLAPILELSLRQSLAMSAGDYGIFLHRPIATTMLGLGALLFLLSVKPLIFKKKDWRIKVELDEAKDRLSEGSF